MKNNKRTNKRGSAILLTLGVLSMALVMGMCFAFAARTNLQTAAVTADQTKARLLAESGLNKVMALLQDLERNGSMCYYPPRKTGHTYSFTNEAGSTIRYMASCSAASADWMYKNDYLVKQLPSLNDVSTPPQFQPIYTGTNPNEKIVGRLGFIVIDDTDKIDINQTLSCKTADNLPFVKSGENGYAALYDTTGNAFNTVGTNDFKYSLTPVNADINAVDASNTLRLGLSLREIQIDNRATYWDNRISNGAATSAKIPYQSYDHLRQAVPTHFYSPTNNTINDYRKYTFFSGKDIEAYWDVTSEIDSTKIEHQRFDLSGYEWKTSTTWDNWSTPGLCPNSGWNQNNLADSRTLVTNLSSTTARPQFYTTDGKIAAVPGITDANFGIPYLNGKAQIAANMVDFCDEDNEVTFSPHTNPLEMTDSPTYCGNENAPALNEFAAAFYLMKTRANTEETDETKYTYTYSLSLQTYLELLNIYPNLGYQASGKGSPFHSGTAVVKLIADITTQVADEEAQTTEITPTSTWTYSHTSAGVRFVPVTVVDITDNVAKQQTDIPLTFSSAGPYGVDKSIKITIKVKSVRMVLFSDQNSDNTLNLATETEQYDATTYETIYDIAIWNGNISSDAIVLSDNDKYAPATGYPWVFDLQCADPRLNHKSASWTANTPALGTPLATACPTLNGVIDSSASANNSALTDAISTDGNDNEPNVNFSTSGEANTFSTAFIPNRPFVSIWELGCIHTGEAFKTLDITGTDITDQVKIGPLKFRHDTFNPNSNNTNNVYTNLLARIDPETTYWAVYPYPNSTTTYSGPTTSESNSYTIPTDIWASTTCDYKRSTFANILKTKIITESTWDTLRKRHQDALFGRTVGFLSTRYCKYSILITAEALQEIEGATASNWSTLSPHILNPTTITLSGTVHYLSIRGTQRILAHVVHDTWRNKLEVIQLEYLKE